MCSLVELQALLVRLDPNNFLNRKFFDRTWNKQLGFTNSADFYVGILYKPWPQSSAAKPVRFESTLGITFRDVLKRGIVGVPTTSEGISINITRLAGG
jgi:hypothetical protein